MVFLVVVNSTSIVLAEEELNQNDADNGNFVFKDSESITIRIEGINSSSISVEKNVTESGKVGKMIVDIISHPLILLLIGAGITGFLIPKFAESVQARKESFEIKKELIKKINKSTTILLGTTQMLARQKINEEVIYPEFLKWKESCAEIGADVRAYWDEGEKESAVEKEWNAYYDRVVDLYNVITKFCTQKERIDIEKKLKSFFTLHDPKLRLEYEIDDVRVPSGEPIKGVDTRIKKFFETAVDQSEPKDNAIEKFFKTAVVKSESKDNAKEYPKAFSDLIYLFDKRKYYLLKLIFTNKIRPQ